MPIATTTSRPPMNSAPSHTHLGTDSKGPQASRAPSAIRARPPRSAPTGANLASGDAVTGETVAERAYGGPLTPLDQVRRHLGPAEPRPDHRRHGRDPRPAHGCRDRQLTDRFEFPDGNVLIKHKPRRAVKPRPSTRSPSLSCAARARPGVCPSRTRPVQRHRGHHELMRGAARGEDVRKAREAQSLR